MKIHTEDCEVGNVSGPETFTGHEGLREFGTSYRSTYGEMRSEFRAVFYSRPLLLAGEPRQRSSVAT